jgi:hypothetical protein
LLPSLRYHPAQGELADGELQLPWPATEVVIGRWRATRCAGAGASGCQRQELAVAPAGGPHGADPAVGRGGRCGQGIAGGRQRLYLAHLRSAWNARFPAQPLEKQQIVLTIPASFDEGARALTLEAARMAGLPSLRLLEEPQAAFYDWLFRQRASLGEQLADTRLVLVCDVGGGTTDFSLMKVNAGAAASRPSAASASAIT